MEEYHGSPKQRYRILVLGNNAVESSQLFEKLQLSYPGNNSTQIKDARLEFYAYPDLDLFNRFQEPQIDDTINKLIGDTTDYGGVSLFIILISQTEVFSNNMKEMITKIPKDIHFKSEHYFWDHAAVLFSFEEKRTDYQEEVSKSIRVEGNVGIKEVVERAGNRYIWMSNFNTKEEIAERILSQCKEIDNGHFPQVHCNKNNYYSRKGLCNMMRSAISWWCIILLILLFIFLATVIVLVFTGIIIIVLPPTTVLIILVGPIITVFFACGYCMLRGIPSVYDKHVGYLRYIIKHVNRYVRWQLILG